MPYLCWIYNDDIQQELVGVNTCDLDILNTLPAYNKKILSIGHNSDYDCIFILEYLQNVKPIVESNRFLHIKATYYNPKYKTNINIIVKYSYKLIPMPLRYVGKWFKLDVSKQVMPYKVYTYENVTMGACSIQSALGSLKDDDKTQFLDNLDNWDCILGKGMDNQMFDLIKYSSMYCKMDCKVLMDGYEVFRQWLLEPTEIYVYNYITIQSMASSFMLNLVVMIMFIKSLGQYSNLLLNVLLVAEL